MANEVESELVGPLFEALQKERFCFLSTVDYESGGPNTAALSWLLAADIRTIRFVIEQKSRAFHNVRKNQQASITVMMNESAYSITGKAFVKDEQIPGIPLKLSLIELKIAEVRDIMFYGARIIKEPQYDKTYDKKAADKLDQQVMDALRMA
ncbi:pyridoxamine 5'-phosphate oxidase family protein [Peribacillus kribbensis]|uniref:pyridoxamine 5'-phosphate oxidase family protein n=1 Tax=Peribacillus kribbensis TaxID=356658 RepID=UPI00040315F0|nr:pyridoxamine 5'-phosphate oxidase family protein [Peribacillus kribbensis]